MPTCKAFFGLFTFAYSGYLTTHMAFIYATTPTKSKRYFDTAIGLITSPYPIMHSLVSYSIFPSSNTIIVWNPRTSVFIYSKFLASTHFHIHPLSHSRIHASSFLRSIHPPIQPHFRPPIRPPSHLPCFSNFSGIILISQSPDLATTHPSTLPSS